MPTWDEMIDNQRAASGLRYGGTIIGGGARGGGGGSAETGFSYGPGTAQQPGASGANEFNLGQASSIQGIADLINKITQNATKASQAARIPGAAGLEEQSSANIGSELKGTLPADVQQKIAQQAAAFGVSQGISGSPAANLNYLRALGLTSLDLTGKGQSELSAAYARNPAAPIFDPSQLLITPYQGAQLGLEQGRLDLEAQNLAAQRARAVGGGGGGGGGGYYPTTRTAAAPAAAPYYGSYATDSRYSPSTAWNSDPTAAWLASIGYGSGTPTTTGAGNTTMTSLPADQASFSQLSNYTGDTPAPTDMPTYA